MGLRDLVLQAQDLKRVPVVVPEWNCTVYVRTLTGAERVALEQLQKELADDELSLICKFIVATVCDENGVMQFTDGDIPALKNKSVTALLKVYAEALKLNTLTKEAVDETEKN